MKYIFFALVMLGANLAFSQEAHYCADKEFFYYYGRCDGTGNTCKGPLKYQCSVDPRVAPPTEPGVSWPWKLIKWSYGTNLIPYIYDEAYTNESFWGTCATKGAGWGNFLKSALRDWVALCPSPQNVTTSQSAQSGRINVGVDLFISKSGLDLRNGEITLAATILDWDCYYGDILQDCGDPDNNYSRPGTKIIVNYTDAFMADNRWLPDYLTSTGGCGLGGRQPQSSRFIMYHEMGHIFGIPDQKDKKCKDNQKDVNMLMWGGETKGGVVKAWKESAWNITLDDECMFCKMYCANPCFIKASVQNIKHTSQQLVCDIHGNTLVIKFPLVDEPLRISVLNTLGQQIFDSKSVVLAAETQISLDNISSGHYIVRVETGSQVFSRQILYLKR